ncbi:MAG: RNA methyltransferase [Candidatus Nanopelagicales bacterium]
MTDPADPRVHDYVSLTDVALRRVREPAEGLFMAESLSVMERALTAGYRPRSVLTEPRWVPDVDRLLTDHDTDCPVFVGSRPVITATTGFRLHRGPMAAMTRRALPRVADALAGARLVVVLSGLVDHTNVGAAFRSAAALGVDSLLVTTDCADPLYRRSVRVSMGAVFSIPWTVTTDWATDLSGFRTVALTPAPDAVPLGDLAPADRPTALILGTEGPGLPARQQDRASIRARIPMAAGVDSLNVAAAVAVACYAVADCERRADRSHRMST